VTDPEPLLDYIVRQRGQFTREAINAELLKAGHPQSAIDAAWAALESEEQSPASRLKPGIGTILLVLVVIFSYVGTTLFALSFTTPGYFLSMTGTQAWIVFAYSAAMAIACIVSVWRLLRAPSTGGGAHAIGVALTISVVLFLGLGGLCFAGLLLSPSGA
jgi:hypothetical protein